MSLKVHFAGLENEDFARIMRECGDVRYALFTALPFLAHKVGVKAMKMGSCTERSVQYLQQAYKHVIMDSGLFSLMFGAHAGPRDEAFVAKWTELLIEFAITQPYTGTMVEVDCQKILGPKEAWKYRQRMREALPNRIISVFHLDDGQKGLDRLIEYSDYIAVSLPELRATGKKGHARNLVNYIKNKKPSIDIHLLGCTENALLRDLNFCTSADSTAWQQVNRYGNLKFHNGKRTKSIQNSKISNDTLEQRYGTTVRNILTTMGVEVTPKRLDYYTKYGAAAELCRAQYAIHAGSQD